MLYNKKKIVKIVETIFNVTYLGTVLILAFIFSFSASPDSFRFYFGILAFILVFGDSFHLVPRVAAMWDSKKDYEKSMGIGKMITSVTMTIFYAGLWFLGLYYYELSLTLATVIVIILIILRIVLCIMPQNKWTSTAAPYNWTILRNIPFFLLGAFVTVLFIYGGIHKPSGLSFLSLAVFISFTFYLPVVLYAHKNPKIGMFMLPKSCAYVAIILMGFSLI